MTKRGVWVEGRGIGRLAMVGGIECSRIGTAGSTTGNSQPLLAMLPNLNNYLYPHPSLILRQRPLATRITMTSVVDPSQLHSRNN